MIIKDQNTHIISDFDNGDQQDPNGESQSASSAIDIEQALAAKAEEAQASQDKFLRLAAEFDNYKRLAQRDQREYAKFANENLLKELLPTLDNLERALGFGKDYSGGNGLLQGVELTLKQFLETLAKFGVRPIHSVGQAFDPSRHQAVATVASEDAPANTVVEEYQKGYLLNDRVLRPAMVTVAASSNETTETSDARTHYSEEGEHHG